MKQVEVYKKTSGGIQEAGGGLQEVCQGIKEASGGIKEGNATYGVQVIFMACVRKN
jgi:hypothetical protein